MWDKENQNQINDQNIAALLNHIISNIMPTAVRLKTTMEQAKYQALTTYQTIGRAMVKHPLMSWHVINKLAPGELMAFESAMEIVGSNSYYGYSKDLSAVKAARYRNLGYLAKELLTRCDGKTHLSSNRAFDKKPTRAALLDKIIEMYVKARNDEGEVDAPTPAHL